MPSLVTPSRVAAVDSFVKEFEAAWYRDGAASVSAFLPPPNHPLYPKVARELVRVDLELGWDCGRPRTLDDYRAAYPDLLSDLDLLQAIAFEEYRQRREHGETPDADDYARRYGVCTEDWPGADASGSADLEATAHTDRDLAMEAASLVYRQFRQQHTGNGAHEFDPHDARTGMVQEAIELFHAVHRSDPGAADSLAEAVLAMPQVGSHFLGFRLVAELGRGAFGRVYLAHQHDIANRLVALKITADLEVEKATQGQLLHTNIVPVYSVHRASHFEAACMPYCGATTLADVLSDLRKAPALPASGKQLVSTLNDRKHSTRRPYSAPPNHFPSPPPTAAGAGGRGDRLPPWPPTPHPRRGGEGGAMDTTLEALGRRSYVGAVLWMTAKLADGLAYAHENGIVHRDLKPANVLLADNGQPMLLDFNLAQDTKRHGGAAGARMGGTLPYMAPEQMEAFAGRPAAVDARSDLFALGVIIFELLTGKFPFPARPGVLHSSLPLMALDRRQPPPRLCPLNRAVTPAVEAIVRRCLAPEPVDRYPSARALQEDIERHLADLPLRHTAEPSWRERGRKWVRRHPRLTSSTAVGAAAAVLLLAGAAGAVAYWQKQQAVWGAAEQKHARLAAVERLDQFRLVKHQQQALLNEAERSAVHKVIDLSRTGLAGYGLPDNPAWQESPLVTRLPPDEQEKLRQDVAEMLLTWADAERVLGEGESDASRRAEQLTRAWRLTERAEKCLAGQECKTLWRQRARLASLLDRDDADDLAEKADAAVARTAGDHFFQAREYLRQREFRRALQDLQKVTRQDSQHFWAWFLLGNCYFELRQYPEAINCYSACAGMNPDPSVAYFPYSYRSMVYSALGQVQLAEADWATAEEHLAYLPPDLQPRERFRSALRRAKLLEKKKDYAGAENVLTDALDLKFSETEILLERSYVRDKLKDRRGAQRDRDECMERQPTDEAGWNTRGLAELTRNPRAALTCFGKALALNPHYYPALQNQAHVLAEKLDKPAEALAVLNRIVEMYPGYVPARIGRGVVLARQGKRAEAHADAIESLARDRGAATCYQAANVYALTSRQEPADRERVLPLLASALFHGFGLDVIDDDSDMDPVRDQVSFQRLVAVVRELQSEVQGKKP